MIIPFTCGSAHLHHGGDVLGHHPLRLPLVHGRLVGRKVGVARTGHEPGEERCEPGGRRGQLLVP